MPRVSDSGEPSTSRSTRKNKNKNKNKNNSRGGGSLDLDPVIEIDDVSNDESRGSRLDDEDPGVRALQVEADEMLARELQEQLYNEELAIASAFGVHEVTFFFFNLFFCITTLLFQIIFVRVLYFNFKKYLLIRNMMTWQEHSSHATHAGGRPTYRPASVSLSLSLSFFFFFF